MVEMSMSMASMKAVKVGLVAVALLDNGGSGGGGGYSLVQDGNYLGNFFVFSITQAGGALVDLITKLDTILF